MNVFGIFKKKRAMQAAEFVGICDRFLTGFSYNPYEWDDFLSEPLENPTIEKIREDLGKFEHLLFSKSDADKKRYREIVLDARNTVSAIIGMPTASSPDP